MLEAFRGIVKPGSVEEILIKQIDFSSLPRHVAVIMDGNGRWAKKKNLPRIEGHRAGAKSVQEIVETAARLGIKYLTLFAFSKENWKRPASEVLTLWNLLEEYLKREDKVLLKNNFRMNIIGQIDEIPLSTQEQLVRVTELTKNNDRLIITLALNYGGRAEIVNAIKKLVKENDFCIDTLDEEKFSQQLYTASIPDPDLLIRTSGEFRISNFLLWQIAYSEIWITDEFWPDFRKKHFFEAIIDFQKRERRFGDVIPRGRTTG